MMYEKIDNAQRCVAKIIKKHGHKKLRKKRHQLNKLVRKILKHYHLKGTSVESYYRHQFLVALLGLEYIWLPQPRKVKL